MNRLTIRGVDENLHTALKREADQRGISLNQLILILLEETMCVVNSRSQPPFDDLDHMAGTWSHKEANEFEIELKNQRSINEF
jgi:hypothetical protein